MKSNLNDKYQEIVTRINNGERQTDIRKAMALTKGSLSGAIFSLRKQGYLPKPTNIPTKGNNMKKEMSPPHKEVYDLIKQGRKQTEIAKLLNKNSAQVGGIVNRLRVNGHLPKTNNKPGRPVVTQSTPTPVTQPKLSQVIIEQPSTDKYIVIVGSNLKEILACLS